MAIAAKLQEYPAAVHGAVDASTERPHTVQFYDGEDFLLVELAGFVRGALLSGQSVIVVATEAHREALVSRLAESGLSLSSPGLQHRYISVDAAETLNLITVRGTPEKERFRTIIGALLDEARTQALDPAAPVAVFGEMVALLMASGRSDEAIALEHLWNELAETYSFALLCGYPMSLFASAGDAERMRRVCTEHSRVLPTEGYCSLENDPQRLRAVALLEQKAKALETECETSSRLLIREKAAREMAESALESRDEFLSIAAHELKTPITILKGYSQLLHRKLQEDVLERSELEDKLQVLDRAAEALAMLVNDLLGISGLKTGEPWINREIVDLRELTIEAIAHLEASLASDHRLSLQTNVGRALVLVERRRIRDVISQLLNNAIRYSPHGGLTEVTIEPNDGGILFSVTDEGIGLADGTEDTVFEPFRRGSHSSATHPPGLGLGLYMCKKIVESYGGHIRAGNRTDRPGAHLLVWLPAVSS